MIVLREWSDDAVDCNIPATVVTEITPVGGEVSSYRLNSYCKMHNRFITFDNYHLNSGNCNKSQAIPITNRKIKTIPRYQIFALIIFCSSIIVIIPHILWKCSNKSMIKSVVNRIRSQIPENGYPTQHNWDKMLRNTLNISEENGHQFMFCLFYLTLKFVNFLILLGLIFTSNHMLHYQFLEYPLFFLEKYQLNHLPLLDQKNLEAVSKNSILNCTSKNSNIPAMMYEDIFPKYALCPYTYLDATSVESKMILVNCLMPINSLLEQIFFFLWFWYALMFCLTLLDALRYGILYCSRTLRQMILKYNTNNILSTAVYNKASATFSSWLFVTIVIIDNHSNYQFNDYQSLPQMEANPLYFPMKPLPPSNNIRQTRIKPILNTRRPRLDIIPEESEE